MGVWLQRVRAAGKKRIGEGTRLVNRLFQSISNLNIFDFDFGSITNFYSFSNFFFQKNLKFITFLIICDNNSGKSYCLVSETGKNCHEF